MKAWILDTEYSDCASLVFAETRGKAKAMANNDSPFMYQSDIEAESYLDVRCRRLPELDDWEDQPELEICLRLMELDSWWFEVGNRRFEADNIDEFKRVFVGSTHG